MLYSEQTLELHSKKEKFPMKDLGKHICRIAVVQAEPVLFNKQESLKKTLCYIEEAVKNNAELIVFPELFIPGYPFGMNFGFSVGKTGRDIMMLLS